MMTGLSFGNFALLQLVGVGFALAGALLMLAGVALGGYLVFRTKRETHEPLFKVPSLHKPDLKPYHIDEDGEDLFIEEPDDDAGFYDEGMHVVDSKVNEFIKQQAEKRKAI